MDDSERDFAAEGETDGGTPAPDGATPPPADGEPAAPDATPTPAAGDEPAPDGETPPPADGEPAAPTATPPPAAGQPPAPSATPPPKPAATPAPAPANELDGLRTEIMGELKDITIRDADSDDPAATETLGQFAEKYPSVMDAVTASIALLAKRITARYAPIMQAHQASAADAAREGLIGALLKPGADGKPLVPEARELPGDVAFWKLIDERAPKAIKAAVDSGDPESVAVAVDWARRAGWAAASARRAQRQERRTAAAELGQGNLRGGQSAEPGESAASLRAEFEAEKDDGT